MLRVRGRCRDEARRVQSSAVSIRTHITTRYYFWFTVAPGGTNSLWTTSRESKRVVINFLSFYLLTRAFVCLGDCNVCHSSLFPSVSGSYSKNQLSSPVMTWVRKLFQFWVVHTLLLTLRFDGHFDRHSNFWNYLCTQFSHVQILCNNLVDHTFVNILFNDDHWNC
jgi:hypothetical protein